MILELLAPKIGASTYANPTDWLRSALTGGLSPTMSGENVNPISANNYSAVFAARRAIAETVSSVPLPVYRRLAGGGKERVTDDIRHRLLNRQPNPWMTAIQFREFLLDSALGWGNGIATIDGDLYDDSVQLSPVHTSFVTMEDKNSGPVYVIRQPGEPVRTLTPDRVIHVKGITSNGLWGISIIRLAREAIGLGITAEKHGAAFFANGARTSGAFVLPQKPEKAKLDQLRGDLEKAYTGAMNSGKFMMLFGGMDYKTFSMPHDDAQFLETRRFQIEEIARWFRVPPNEIGDYGQMKWANIEQAALTFVQTLRVWMVRIEQELNAKLFPATEQDDLFVEHLVDGLLRGDAQSRATSLQIQRRNGVINANEWRAIENMNPIEDGDKYIIEGNMTTLEKVGEEPEPEPVPDMVEGPADGNGSGESEAPDANRFSSMSAAFHDAIEDAVACCLRREANETKKAADKYSRNNDREYLESWAGEFYTTHEAYCRSKLLPLVSAYFKACGVTTENEAGVDALMAFCMSDPKLLVGHVVGGKYAAFTDRIAGCMAVEDKVQELEALCR